MMTDQALIYSRYHQ